MITEKLQLKNFRNYQQESFEFVDGINIFYGNNGQGKTNVLEALFLASMGKSFRTSHDIEMIKDGCEGFEIDVEFSESTDRNIKIGYNKAKQKYIKVNGIYLRKMGDLMGTFPTVVFSPNNMVLLSSGPSERRKFMDMALCQLKPVYYFNLQQYNKILMQKNAFLKNSMCGQVDKNMLDVWNMSLAEIGSEITKERISYIEKVGKYASVYHHRISGNNENITVKYENSAGDDKETFYRKLTDSMQREIDRGMSLIGPHKDDIELVLDGTGDMKKYGSQGQRRTLVLALKLSETQILEEETGKRPVLLLDDVLSELDDERQRLLLKNIEKTQVFITCTSADRLKNASERTVKLFRVSNGKVVI